MYVPNPVHLSYYEIYISIINPLILLYLHIPNHHYLSLKVISLQMVFHK